MKAGVCTLSEYINTKYKLQFYVHLLLRDFLSEQDQIHYAGTDISGENTYQIWSKSCQQFLIEIWAFKSCSFSSGFFSIVFFFLNTCHKMQMRT